MIRDAHGRARYRPPLRLLRDGAQLPGVTPARLAYQALPPAGAGLATTIARPLADVDVRGLTYASGRLRMKGPQSRCRSRWDGTGERSLEARLISLRPVDVLPRWSIVESFRSGAADGSTSCSSDACHRTGRRGCSAPAVSARNSSDADVAAQQSFGSFRIRSGDSQPPAVVRDVGTPLVSSPRIE